MFESIKKAAIFILGPERAEDTCTVMRAFVAGRSFDRHINCDGLSTDGEVIYSNLLPIAGREDGEVWALVPSSAQNGTLLQKHIRLVRDWIPEAKR
jgi:hypothetical protein